MSVTLTVACTLPMAFPCVGIPELRSVDDLNYMKVALALHRQEPEARDYFRSKLQEARRKAWTISMNWYVHGLAKDNSKF